MAVKITRLIGCTCLVLLAGARAIEAQTPRDEARMSRERCWFARLPIELTGGVRAGAPFKVSGYGGLVLLRECWAIETAHGIELSGEIGKGGRGLALGLYQRDEGTLIFSALASYFQTTSSSWSASPHAHYIGPEMRLSIEGVGIGLAAYHRAGSAPGNNWAFGATLTFDGWLCCTSKKH